MNDNTKIKLWAFACALTIVIFGYALFIMPVSAYNITSEVNNTKLIYHLDQTLKVNDSVYFDGELLDYPIDKEIVINGLESGREYELRVFDNDTRMVYTHYISTTGFNFEDSFAQYAVIGILFLSLIVCLFIPYSGVIIIIVAFFNLISAAQTGEKDGVIIGIYFLIIVIAGIIETERDSIKQAVKWR